MTAMKARMKVAKVVAPPKAMQAKKAKKEEQWIKKKNAELQQAKRDNVRLSVEFASIQAVALERADNKDAELQRVKRDNERLVGALECIMQAALVGDKGLSDEDLDSEINAVEQLHVIR